MTKLLLIEDEPRLAEDLRNVFESEGYQVTSAPDAPEGIAAARRGEVQVVVTDYKMPSGSGIDVVRTLHEVNPKLPVILMTGHHSTETAIEAMKLGAYDYVLKPPDMEELVALIGRAVASSKVMVEPIELGTANSTNDAIVGTSRVMQNVYKQIGQVAAMPVSVLIRGETGTGKELVARAIYQHSPRSMQPFIEVNCAAIPENLLESELFGHEPGAFTDAKTRRIGRFEQAHRGTIFLDEIGDMGFGTQAKLLRVLQNRTIQRLGGKETINVDVRVIAATHRDLESAIKEHEFREDLYHRLNDSVIFLPPLRDRGGDIPGLVRFFIQRYGVELGSSAPGMPTGDALSYLEQHSWPGNVRELRNVIRKSLLLSRGYPLTREIVAAALTQTQPIRSGGDQSIAAYISELLGKAQRGEVSDVHVKVSEAVERELYAQAIRAAAGDQSKAAHWLGVSRPTIRERLIKYGLHPSHSKSEENSGNSNSE